MWSYYRVILQEILRICFWSNSIIWNVTNNGAHFCCCSDGIATMCQEMVSPILGALLPPPMELDEDDDILPPQAVKRPAENVPLDINLILFWKMLLKGQHCFSLVRGWTLHIPTIVMYCKYPGFIWILKKKYVALHCLPHHSSFFENFNQPTIRGHRHWQLHESSVGQPILCATTSGVAVTWNLQSDLMLFFFRYF